MKKIPRSVLVLGAVSFFNDFASEMIYPVVPIFLTTVLGAPVAVVGLIEGIAEATASIMKFVFGYISDRVGKRKIFVGTGYSLAAASKLLIAIAVSWPFILFARIIDRLGKGIRTSARDSLLLQYTNRDNKGFIFGLHRSLDSAGAVFGPVAALLLLALMKENLRYIFYIAFIPAFTAVILLFLFVREKKGSLDKHSKKKINLSMIKLSPKLRLFLLISFIFALGNSSDAFLILRAKDLGLTTTMTIATYILYNIVQTILATPAGQLADKVGARRVYALGLAVFAAVYFLFGIVTQSVWLWFLFPIYGLYIAATDGVSKAYIAEFITERESGTYFGLYQTGVAICGFLASFAAGILWTIFSPGATFFYGAGMALLAFLTLFYAKAVKRL